MPPCYVSDSVFTIRTFLSEHTHTYFVYLYLDFIACNIVTCANPTKTAPFSKPRQWLLWFAGYERPPQTSKICSTLASGTHRFNARPQFTTPPTQGRTLNCGKRGILALHFFEKRDRSNYHSCFNIVDVHENATDYGYSPAIYPRSFLLIIVSMTH